MSIMTPLILIVPSKSVTFYVTNNCVYATQTLHCKWTEIISHKFRHLIIVRHTKIYEWSQAE